MQWPLARRMPRGRSPPDLALDPLSQQRIRDVTTVGSFYRSGMIFGLVTIGLGALASSYRWWLASWQRLRRISLLEELDVGDMNRVVTALNRTQIQNARAALLASTTAALAAVRIGVEATLDF